MAEPLRSTYVPRRRPCFECSQCLQYMKGKGYYAVLVEVDGIDRLMHKYCAENRGNPVYEHYVSNLEEARARHRA